MDMGEKATARLQRSSRCPSKPLLAGSDATNNGVYGFLTVRVAVLIQKAEKHCAKTGFSEGHQIITTDKGAKMTGTTVAHAWATLNGVCQNSFVEKLWVLLNS